jgi:hypothetical protein
MSANQSARTPDVDCGSTGTIWSVLVPPTSFQVTGPLSEELISEALHS